MSAWIDAAGVAAVVLAVLGSIVAYNRLVRLRTRCDHAFAQIEVQLKRRYELIPNLVECVKGTMVHEREMLERVIATRNHAVAILQEAVQRPGDRDVMQAWTCAEGSLTSALGRLAIAIENAPGLKTNAAVAALTEQLTTTENRIAFARQVFNDWVSGFNTCRQRFPTCVVAALCGFNQDRDHLEFADQAIIAEAPRVLIA